jgi:hypothetical protein
MNKYLYELGKIIIGVVAMIIVIAISYLFILNVMMIYK